MSAILQILFDALSLGSLYALGALGIALIFGVMRLVNFAHGDVISFSISGRRSMWWRGWGLGTCRGSF